MPKPKQEGNNKIPNFISVLLAINELNLKKLKINKDEETKILEILEKLGLITIISSNKLVLTPLGKSLINKENDEIKKQLDHQEKLLNVIHNDLRNIKSVLASLSLESFRNPQSFSGLQDTSILTQEKNLNSSIYEPSKKKDPIIEQSKSISFSSDQELYDYYTDLVRDFDLKTKKQFLKSGNKIGEIYKKIESLSIVEGISALEEAVFESYLFVDAVLNFFLKINYSDVKPQHLSKPLVDKLSFCKNLMPFVPKYEVVMFLDEFKKDFETRKEIKMGKKTFNRIYKEISQIFEKFAIFLELVFSE